VTAMRRVIIQYKYFFEAFLFFPIPYFEDILLGTLLIVVLIFRPSGLIPEKLLYIPGVNYRGLVREEAKVDWRTAPKARAKGGGRLKLGRRKEATS